VPTGKLLNAIESKTKLTTAAARPMALWPEAREAVRVLQGDCPHDLQKAGSHQNRPRHDRSPSNFPAARHETPIARGTSDGQAFAPREMALQIDRWKCENFVQTNR
jgi:hypothetical protein